MLQGNDTRSAAKLYDCLAPYWETPEAKLSPVPSGAFCFLMCLRGYSDSLAGVITSHSCGVAAWIHCGGGRDHGNSHFSNRLNLDAAPV